MSLPLNNKLSAGTFAKMLLDVGAVQLSPDEPFVWASGKVSPVYCDNRLTLSDSGIRRAIAHGMVALIEQEGWGPEVIAGTATAGIPHATLVADRLALPLVYVRSAPKGHGRGRQVEGKLREGQRVVIIEDLVSTGSSVCKVAQALREAGAIVEGMVAIFSYQLPEAEENLRQAQLPWRTLTNFDVLLQVAQQKGQLSPDSLKVLQEWRETPDQWNVT